MDIRKIVHSRTGAVIAGSTVLVTLGGVSGAVAATQITSHDIKDQTIQKRDIGPDAVGSDETIDGSLGMKDLNDYTQGRINDRGGQVPPGPTPVTSLGGAFDATNQTVSLTGDGIEAGPYADGGNEGGSLKYTGLNGQPLSAVKSLVYHGRYVSTGDTGGVGAPYLRIFTKDSSGNEHDAIFSPNTQTPDPDIQEGPFHEWVATSGTWRYDDDPGNNPGAETSFANIVADHGSEKITGIYVTTGYSAGQNLASLVRSMEVNGVTYDFGG